MSDATDQTGSYDGTPSNVNFNVAGKFGNAGYFNGSSSNISLTHFYKTMLIVLCLLAYGFQIIQPQEKVYFI